MPDFWPSCGYRLLTVGTDGRLTVTDDFLRSYLVRPELAPIRESCAAELALHDALLGNPRRNVPDAELAAIEDPDARENYGIWLRFRARLLAASSLEAAYVELFQGSGVDVPPLFVAQLTQVLLRHILGTAANPMEARVAEMLFRPQKVAILEDGAVMAADETTVELFATTGGFGSLGELLAQSKTPSRAIELDVLDADNAALYWERDERHDLSVSLNRGRPALDALARVLERWIAHFLAVEVKITHERAIDDKHWVWHVGLDAEASSLLNDLYNGVEIDDVRMSPPGSPKGEYRSAQREGTRLSPPGSPKGEYRSAQREGSRMTRLLCLFRLEFAHVADMRPALAGKPVYLAMAMDGEQRLKLKPQNLLLNLPLARQQ